MAFVNISTCSHAFTVTQKLIRCKQRGIYPKRLKRDKQDLIDLIGRLTIDVDKLNKKKDKLF